MIKYVFTLLYLVLILTGCGTVKNTNTPDLRLIQLQEAEIDSCINNGDIQKLIELHNKYISHRAYIEQYIEYKYNFATSSYGDLLSMRLLTGDPSLTDVFNRVIDNREDCILNNISGLSVQELGAYYKLKMDEQQFLRPIIDTIVNRNDYREVKLYRKHFSGTDISESLDSVYWSMRAKLLPIAQKALEGYMKEEGEYLLKLKANTQQNINCKIEEALPTIIENVSKKVNRDFFDKLFSSDISDDYTIEKYVVLTVNNLYDINELNNIINNPISTYVESANQNRRNFAEYYFDDVNMDSVYINCSKFANLEADIPLYDIRSIQEIKDKINWISWGLTAIGFIPGVGTAIAAAIDVADLLYSYFADTKEAKEINKHIEQFSTKLFKNYKNNTSRSVSEIYDSFQHDVVVSQTKLRTLFNENF